jgi:putative heme-binding domain-containing protein
MHRAILFLLAWLFCLPAVELTEDRAAQAEESAAQDSAVHAPTPEEAREKIHLAAGLQLQLFASEPLIQQPVSISFDDRGRMWVLEYIQYPNPNGLKATAVDQYLRTKYDRVPDPPPHGPKGNDRITILEDTDGDGRADRAKPFLSGLNLASGMAIGYGGVFVAQPPYLLFYADHDRDDVPDGDPEVLLSGFGMEDAHAFANSLTWGPDGWLYGAQGSTVTANIRGIEFQQGIWRYHVRTKRFELFAEGGGNTWGIDFDRQGRLFAGGNTTEPLCHHVQGAYYIKGFGKHGPLHNPFAFGYFNPVKHVGFLGSALTGGAVLYQGGLLPERFDGAAIYPNLRANAMRVAQLKPRGSTFETHFQEDFAVSSDVWFRPVDCLVGPDGALYAADWCDVNISHTSPKDRSQWYPPSRSDGRIWRFVPSGAEAKPMGPLGLEKLASAKLVELLDHKNAWYSREARRILGERQDAEILGALQERLTNAASETSALEALWAICVSGGFDDALAETLLDDRFAAVREWTVRLLGDERKISPALLPKLVALAERETDLHVRSQLASTAKRLPGEEALAIVEPMLARDEDAADPHLPLLIWWAVEDKAMSDSAQVLSLIERAEVWKKPLVRDTLVERLARRFAGDRSEAGWAACGQLLYLAPDAAARNALLAAIDLQLAESGGAEPPGEVVEAIAELLSEQPLDSAAIRVALRMRIAKATELALVRIADRRAGEADRAALLETLAAVPRAAYVEKLLPLVEGNEPPAIKIAAMAALQPYESPEIARTLIGRYSQMTPEVQARVRTMLASRAAWAESLVAAVEQKTIPAADVGIDQVRQTLAYDLPELAPRIEALWGKVGPATSREKQGRIVAVQQILAKGKGDPANGQKLVAKHCQTCHTLFGQGNRIGPDLTGVDRKNLAVLVPNVVDPSSVVRAEYVAYAAETADGRTINGLLAASTADTVTLVDAQNIRTTLARSELDSFEPSPLSLMPERLLDPLADQELRDLFAYLQSDQNPSAAPAKAAADAKTSR